ncbi:MULTISPECIES: TetR/AcrR family transcriptional regulator [unclassified Nocardiopsis]|uniref:TetR/AcrR family transcriptional regulator n=1 Tax=unclassified Nocardiopsis TaxID=2649073 RepID=UPI002104C7D2|nr:MULTISPECIES: TetR family transcriptional regulator [unclassified Nocardiopsis]
MTDGRRIKGERRRRALLDATMRVVERDGVAAVSQRRVAAEAGVPPSAVTYYYATVDDLLVDALTRVNDTYVAALAALPEDADAALRALAGMVAGGPGSDRAHVMAECELFLLAARRPALRPQIERWNRAVDAFFAPYLPDPVERAGVCAALDGLFVRGCADPELSAEEVYRTLSLLVRRARRNVRAGSPEAR